MSGLTTGIALVSVAFLGGLMWTLDRMALKMIRPPKKRHRRTVANLPFRARVHHFSSLGQDLNGWVVEPESDDGGPVAVLVHGWGSSHGRMTYLAGPLLQAGHPVFLFDVRYHGESPEAPYVTARHFRDDTVAATREAAALFPGRPLVLVGHSMGGSAAVLAASAGAPIQGVVSIAAPANLWEVWAYHFDERGLPGRWIVRLLSPFWRYRAGVPFRELSPTLRVSEVDVPALVIHGERDESVPVSHARTLATGIGVEPLILEGQGHNDVLVASSVHEALESFLRHLPEASSVAQAGSTPGSMSKTIPPAR